MVFEPKNRFTLIYEGNSTIFVPKNWQDFECVLSRDRLPVDQTVGQVLEVFGDAATVITTAYTTGNDLVLTVERQDDTLQYTDMWSFRPDMETYTKNGSIISIGWFENTVRDEIEKNKGTKYDIPIPNVHSMSYTGVSRDKSNVLVAETSGQGYFVHDIQRTASNWMIKSVKEQSQPNDSFIFTDYDAMHARALKDTTASISLKLGFLKVGLPETDDAVTIQLLHCGKTFGLKKTLETFTVKSKSDFYVYNFYDYATNVYTNDGVNWKRNGVHYSTITTTPIKEDDIIVLVVNTRARGGDIMHQQVNNKITRLSFNTTDISAFTDYPVDVLTCESVLTALLAKMCPVPPALTYNLPKYNVAGTWIPIFTSGSALQHAATPKISVSFEDMMQFLRCAYGADYDITGTSIIIDSDNTFFVDTKARDIEYTDNIETGFDGEHVYSRVKAGWKTDDDVENGVQEILCTNTFTVNPTAKEKVLDLVSPFKGSPYTIEQYLDDKAMNTEKTQQQDNDVFVFCVVPFVPAGSPVAPVYTTTLYRSFIYTGHDTYYNLPLSPMRMIIANSRYLGVSLYNRAPKLTFVSTDRKADVTTQLTGEIFAVTENNGEDSALVLGLNTPLFKPEKVSFDFYDEVPTKATVEADRHKYYRALNKKTLETIDLYINDLSLPLAMGKKQSIVGIRK